MSKITNASNAWRLKTAKLAKLTDWSFVSPFDRDDSIKVSVSMAHTEELGSHFIAQVKDPNDRPQMEWKSQNIEELRKQVDTDLHILVDMKNGAEWEDYLEVIVDGRHYTSDTCLGQRNLDLTYKAIKRGTHPAYPGKVFRLNNGHVSKFPSHKEPGQLDPDVSHDEKDPLWKRVGARNLESGYSYVPDLPETRAGLERIIEKMGELQARLAELLEQDQAQDFLLSISHGGNALPLKEEPDITRPKI